MQDYDPTQSEPERITNMVSSILKYMGKADMRRPPDEDMIDTLTKRVQPLLSAVDLKPDFDSYYRNQRNVDFIKAFQLILELGYSKDPSMSRMSLGSQLSTIMWQMFLLGNISIGKARRFQCERELTSVLMYTDVKVPASELIPPFPFMVVKLPKDVLMLDEASSGNKRGCGHLIITRQKMSPEDSDRIKKSVGDDKFALVDTLNVMAVSEPDFENEINETTLVDTLLLRPDKTVEEEIEDLVSSVEQRDKEYFNIRMTVDGSRRNPMELMFSLAANIVLYTTNRSADIVPSNKAALDRLNERVQRLPKGRKRQRALAALNEARKSTVLVIGRNFKAKDQQILQCFRETHSVSVRHMVRGHWKQQPVGAGRQDRKHIFVEPYWRGPELADAIKRDYKLVGPG